MIVSRRYSVYGREFVIRRTGDGALACNCKQYVSGVTMRMRDGRWQALCRHILAFEQESKEPPTAAFDWAGKEGT